MQSFTIYCLWGAEPPLACFSCNNVVITRNSWHGSVLLSTTSPLKPPFSLIPSAKCLIERDRHDKRLRFYVVIVRLFLTIFAVVLILSIFLVKMSVFCISQKSPFVNRNFENLKFSNIPTLLCIILQPLRPLLLFLCCVGRLRCANLAEWHTNRVESPFERGRKQTRSNHESNKVESWFEFGRNLSRAGLNHESIADDFWVDRGKTMSRI